MRIFKTVESWALGAALVMSLTAAPAWSQALPERIPETGLAIIDCAPPAPAPADSCVVRIPPKNDGVRTLNFADASDGANFRFLSSEDVDFPETLKASATAIVIDISQGRGRTASWAVERGYIVDFIEGLPASSSVAVYTVAQSLTQLVGFTNPARAATTVSGIERLTGTTTVLGPNISDVIRELGEREDILLKNIVVVSDGEDESGTVETAQSAAALAIENGVSISAMTTIWRPRGAEQIGAGVSYMRELIGDTLGSYAFVEVNRPNIGSEAATEFSRDFADTIQKSGLIVPTGAESAATIILNISEPIAGQAGEFRDRELRVQFTPAALEGGATPAVVVEEPEEAMLFGFPATYVYIAAAIAALLLALLLFLLFGRKKAEAAPQDATDIVDDDEWDNTAPAPAPAPKAPEPRAWAILMRDDTGERVKVTREKASVGRSADNDVVLNDSTVSRFHASLQRKPDGTVIVSDANSANGVTVNGKKVSGQALVKTGDNLTFGNLTTKLILQ